MNSNKGLVFWFTGLSGSGKSTLAIEIEKYLSINDIDSILLDGDVIRKGLCADLGFSAEDRTENIRRIAEVAKLFSDNGIIVLVAFISPFEKDRQNARNLIGDNFIEIFVNSSLETCENRDVKGLYKKARVGIIPNFTGIDSPYEPPTNPEIIVDTNNATIGECVELIKSKI